MIICICMYAFISVDNDRMKSLMAQPLKFVNRRIISSLILLGIQLFIQVGINFNLWW